MELSNYTGSDGAESKEARDWKLLTMYKFQDRDKPLRVLFAAADGFSEKRWRDATFQCLEPVFE
jgi:hypothetical protein